MVYFSFQYFTEYMNGMKRHLEESWAPNNNLNDQELLGVHSRMDAMGSNLNYVRQKVNKHETQMESMSSTIREVLHFLEQCDEGCCYVIFIHWEDADADVSTDYSITTSISTSGRHSTVYCGTILCYPWLWLSLSSPSKTMIQNWCVACMAWIGALRE